MRTQTATDPSREATQLPQPTEGEDMTTEQTITIDGKVIGEYTVRFWMKQIESIDKENKRLTRLAREMVEGIERMT